MYHKVYVIDKILACNHPVLNEVFQPLCLLYKPTDVLKNITNNWQTVKIQKLQV